MKVGQNNESSKNNSNVFSGRQEGILIQLKQLLMESIQHLDFSDSISDNMEGQLLLCPFFSLLSSLLLLDGSYTKSHVLLVNALYSAHNKSNWAIYSDLLWSHLIQLHMAFPLSGENRNTSKLHVDGSLEKLQNDLASIPLAFGVCPSKIVLKGDTAVANYARLNSTKGESIFPTSKIQGIQSFSSYIAELRPLEVMPDVKSCIINLSQEPSKSLLFPLTEFPMSLSLIGSNLLSLTLIKLDLKSLPLTFGSIFRNLEVSH